MQKNECPNVRQQKIYPRTAIHFNIYQGCWPNNKTNCPNVGDLPTSHNQKLFQ